MAEIAIESDFDIDPLRRSRGHAPIIQNEKLHINDMKEEEAALIRKTVGQMPHIASLIHYPNRKSLDGRVSVGTIAGRALPAVRAEEKKGVPSVETEELEENSSSKPDQKDLQFSTLKASDGEKEKVEEASVMDPQKQERDPNVVSQAVTEFPNLAWEAIKAGLLKEKTTNDQLNAHIKEAEKHQKDIDLLLDFNAEMAGLKQDATELSEKAKDILKKLEERDIHLWKGEDKKLNKERISSLKELSGSHVDKARSKLQNLVLTKIQPKIANIGAIMETLKDIIRNNTKLMNIIIGNTGKR